MTMCRRDATPQAADDNESPAETASADRWRPGSPPGSRIAPKGPRCMASPWTYPSPFHQCCSRKRRARRHHDAPPSAEITVWLHGRVDELRRQLPMARDGAVYACQSCGAVQSKWAGQCPACGAWNSLVEEVHGPPARRAGADARRPARRPGLRDAGRARRQPRRASATGVEEFDRVCGGGVVAGLGDPAGGRSGRRQVDAAAAGRGMAARRGARCAYISGEEAVEQIRDRARRMGLAAAPVKLAAETGCAPSPRPEARALRPGGDRFHPDPVERRP